MQVLALLLQICPRSPFWARIGGDLHLQNCLEQGHKCSNSNHITGFKLEAGEAGLWLGAIKGRILCSHKEKRERPEEVGRRKK